MAATTLDVNLSDTQLLGRLLECDTLEDEQRKAFGEMLGRLVSSNRKQLTPAQRQWAERVYSQLELDAEEGAKNLVSSGAYTPTNAERSKVYDFERMPKPLHPPRRSL
jgi:hypothetical protein